MRNGKLVSLLFCFILFQAMGAHCLAVTLKKELLFNRYSLNDSYTYGEEERSFQWDKIASILDQIEDNKTQYVKYGYLTNYKNRKGKAASIKKYTINEYNVQQDEDGVSRYQAIPLYEVNDTLRPVRYGRDGSLIYILEKHPQFYLVKVASIAGKWLVPKKYINTVGNENIDYVAVIDVSNQNICVLEKSDADWVIRSMNPATTGKYDPPYRRSTPIGIFVLQQKKRKMIYNKDGTTQRGGYAPYASRFNAGGYIHGIPVNLPRTKIVEYSYSLGTSPRSHMCVRNASSHAKFIYDTLPREQSLIIVIQ